MLPPAIDPPVGSRFMIDSAVMVLPQPDSPTIPSVSPGSTWIDTPSTACTTPSLSRISVRRSVISSSGATVSFLSLPVPALIPAAYPARTRRYRRCSRVSNESRSASPMKLNAMQVRMIAMPGG